ncbi:MAG: hypothetical protein OEW06_13765, partial [Gemmatimonadota bacterium]|nr:hypothetical protein [Gemmatimonadota bacterium]
MNRPKFEKAVRSGSWQRVVTGNVTADTAKTWNAQLVRTERLLVPMDVRALVVPPAGGVTHVPTVTAPDPQATEPWPAPPQPFGRAVVRKIGVYLHFAMPDALTRGTRQSAGIEPTDGGVGLPALPDRFLVVRLVHGGTQRREWVLEADAARRTPLASWSEGRQGAPAANALAVIPPEELTAMAGGDVAWAATVDAVVDRFAMHDDLEDIPASKRSTAMLTYFVTGWWSRPDLDPLAGVQSPSQYSARLKSLGWTAPMLRARSTKGRMAEDGARADIGLSSDAPKLGHIGKKWTAEVMATKDVNLLGPQQPSILPLVPSATLLHGTAYGVSAGGKGPDLRPKGEDLLFSLGTHPSDSLAAMLARDARETRASTESMVAAFEMQLLPTLNQPDGVVTLDEERHARAFIGRSGGARSVDDRIAQGDPPGWPRQSGGLAPKTVESGSTTGELAGSSNKAVRLDFGLRRAQARPQLKPALERLREHGTLREPRSFRGVSVPLPRYHHPSDFSLVVRGAARSQRHGGDGRFDAQGRLACRIPSEVITGYSGVLDESDLPGTFRSLGSGEIPPEVDLLLREVVLTDPYRLTELAALAAARRQLPVAAVTQRLEAEAALRHSAGVTNGGAIAPDLQEQLLRASIVVGQDPSPVATHLWSQPWVPLWCEWELSLRLDDVDDGWTLDTLDLIPHEGVAESVAAETFVGRTLLTSAPARALAADIEQWLAEEEERDAAGEGQVTEAQEAILATAAAAAGGADILAGALEGVREKLLGLDPARARMERIEEPGLPRLRPKPSAPPRLLTGGFAKITRLRLVDAFGRHIDVPPTVLDALTVSGPLESPALTPEFRFPARYQVPARIMLRFVDASAEDGTTAVESRVDQESPESSRGPLAGFLLPDHVDEALEFFDAEAEPLGQLMHDPLTGRVIWEGAPGTPGPLGAPPEGDHPAAKHMARLATGLVDADTRARERENGAGESALAALLRVIDTTLWTTDPFGATVTGAVSTIVGRPIAVVRATLRVDILEDMDALDFDSDADRQERQAAYAALAERALQVRLGEVTRIDDGLLAYAIDDAYDQLRVISPEARLEARESGPGEGHFRAFGIASQDAPMSRPVEHPYLSESPAVRIHVGQ